jgi:hypothetical protein
VLLGHGPNKAVLVPDSCIATEINSNIYISVDIAAYNVTVFFLSLYRNALLGPWLNNTEVYLTPFIGTQNHTNVR